MSPMSRRGLLGLAAALPAASGTVRAQTVAAGWPRRPVRVIVPFSPGSTVDIAARAVTAPLQAGFGQPFVAENRTGAGGIVGVDAIAKSTDGHTLGVATNGPIALAKALYRNLPYDPARDLQPVSLLMQAPQILTVHPSLDVHDAAGLVRLARERPGALSYGSVGPGASGQLAMEAFKTMNGVDLVHVPYRGFPEAVLDQVAGRIDAMFAVAAAVLEQVRDGRLRALAVTATERFTQAPDIPTLAEQGMPGLVSVSWVGLVAPAALPRDIVARLARTAHEGLAEPTSRRALERAGFEVVGSTPEAFQTTIDAEARDFGGLIERLGIRLDV
ncbi:Bug family tripartite tricarboxylate transporter substrate binding protein [Roseomonas sp. BN140053]|uniref:Bug family tripartite tricarboxylate transporter substrate binding protein n=1 Tax=Roseomonas sp. BN140053 TaxID=3391898 RepID=UPI0039EBFCB4